jgi:hypothetical protein
MSGRRSKLNPAMSTKKRNSFLLSADDNFHIIQVSALANAGGVGGEYPLNYFGINSKQCILPEFEMLSNDLASLPTIEDLDFLQVAASWYHYSILSWA